MEPLRGKGNNRRRANDQEGSFPRQRQRECWQRVSVALRKAVARQLNAVCGQMGEAWPSPFDPDS